jgi:hypothetical protein
MSDSTPEGSRHRLPGWVTWGGPIAGFIAFIASGLFRLTGQRALEVVSVVSFVVAVVCLAVAESVWRRVRRDRS